MFGVKTSQINNWHNKHVTSALTYFIVDMLYPFDSMPRGDKWIKNNMYGNIALAVSEQTERQ